MPKTSAKFIYRFMNIASFVVLFLALIVGANYRLIDIKDNFEINGGFVHYVNMASHFWTEPGGYNFEEGLKIAQNPDEYVFTHHPKEKVTSSFENEKGWEFILSLLFPEGTKGIQSLAMIVAKYQLMLDLLVIIILFFCARAIIGPLGASLTAIAYALFRPSIAMMGFISYYYWILPFSALSLFFWIVIYRPEEKKYSLKKSILLFFLYGMLMGFAVSLRLNFLFLPLFLSSLIFLRERNFKRSIILVAVMLLGQSVLLLPQFLITQEYYKKFTLSTRGKWHLVINGFGIYPNHFGIKDSGDLTAVNWAIDRGGPDLNKTDIQQYDAFMKKEAVGLIKERPDIFLRNFKNNLYAGITLTPKDMVRYVGGPSFAGIFERDKKYFIFDPKIIRFAHIIPWLILTSGIMLFFFSRKKFYAWLPAVSQGGYFLVILCIFFPPADVHMTAYFPVFVLLLAVAIAVILKVAAAVYGGILRCWAGKTKIVCLPLAIKEYFRQDCEKKYCLDGSQTLSGTDNNKQTQQKKIKYIIISLIVLLCLGLFIVNATYLKDRRTLLEGGKTVAIINSALNAATNGNFEAWSSGEFAMPDGWLCPQLGKSKGIKVKKISEPDLVKLGSASAKIEANSESAYLAYSVPSDILYCLLGNEVTVEGWIKPANWGTKGLYISVVSINRSRYNNQKTAYYDAAGNWQYIEIKYKVPIDAQTVYVLCGADKGSAGYFDAIDMEYTEK
ncbi:MAG: hypothetical protein WC330_00605 [Candidatus Omnitrophota bacterium]|jgi:hypothetical protein